MIWIELKSFTLLNFVREDPLLTLFSCQGEDVKRRPSINLYQSVDDDHPDLQSIQSIVANMNFSADDWTQTTTSQLFSFSLLAHQEESSHNNICCSTCAKIFDKNLETISGQFARLS